MRGLELEGIAGSRGFRRFRAYQLLGPTAPLATGRSLTLAVLCRRPRPSTSTPRAGFPMDIPKEWWYAPLRRPKERSMGQVKSDILQGTLDLMVLQTLDAMGRQHGYGIARRI